MLGDVALVALHRRVVARGLRRYAIGPARNAPDGIERKLVAVENVERGSDGFNVAA